MVKRDMLLSDFHCSISIISSTSPDIVSLGWFCKRIGGLIFSCMPELCEGQYRAVDGALLHVAALPMHGSHCRKQEPSVGL